MWLLISGMWPGNPMAAGYLSTHKPLSALQQHEQLSAPEKPIHCQLLQAQFVRSAGLLCYTNCRKLGQQAVGYGVAITAPITTGPLCTSDSLASISGLICTTTQSIIVLLGFHVFLHSSELPVNAAGVCIAPTAGLLH
eukprot:GHUV01025687.1.p1 GENE.GHUV01025687.1~~GHUV01025687.1.p1  ORF type:complete len:138 (+),score=30.30 GHUV01025687.1:360-773(+)